VLFSVPGLLWSDATAMPHLRALLPRSALAELSVKTRGGVTRCAAGALAVSAGNRTESPTARCQVDPGGWADLNLLNRTSRYDARIGSLGATLTAHHVPTVAVGRLAVPMVAGTAGRASHVVATLRQGLRFGGVIAMLDKRMYKPLEPERATVAATVDARLGKVIAALPSGATLIVAGISDIADDHANLHVFAISGPGWRHTELRSSAAGRAPYVQLIDIAPTILSAAHVPIPPYIVGRPIQSSSTTPPGIAAYVDDNRHATEQRTLGQRVFLVLGIAVILMMLLAAGRWQPGREVARWLARVIAPAPAMIFLANALPWWRWGQPWYAAIVGCGSLAVATVTAVVASRRGTAAVLVAPVFCFAVLVIDQVLGAPLQLSAPLGDSPLIAGRFSGMGNLDFAVMATSAVVLGGVLAGRLRRSAGVLAAIVVAVVAVVIDGAPTFGNDIGGVLALVPASLVLVALVAGVRVTKRRVLLAAVATIGVAIAVAVADYSRPATDQTHVGRFVGQVLHGGASTEVRRKLDSSLASFGWTIGTFVVIFAVILAVACRARIRSGLAAMPGATASAVAATVVGVLGVAVNDSGITIAAMSATVAVSALYGGGVTGSHETTLSERAPALS
jgi:hypothetical protein